VRFRQKLARALLALAAVFTALVSVGLTAPADGPFSIAIQPVFVRVDSTSPQSRMRALGVDLDVKCGPMHLHAAWSAVPSLAASTDRLRYQ